MIAAEVSSRRDSLASVLKAKGVNDRVDSLNLAIAAGIGIYEFMKG